DPAGNQTEGTVLSSVEIDTTPPAQIGTTPDLEDASDTGFLDNDNLTADRTPSFDITSVTDADSILLYFDNTIVASSMVPGGATNVVLTASQQNAGTYSRWVKAKRVDVVGNTSAASDSIKLRIDTDKPSIPSLSGLLPSSDTGFLNSDGYTSDDTPSLIVTNVESIDSIIVTIDGTSNDYSRRTIVSQAGTDTLTTITTLADDVYQLTAVAKDSAGNISSTSGILRVTIDTEPTDPTLTGLAIDLTGVSDTGTENNDDLTNDLTPTFQITNATVSDSLYIVAEDALLNTDTVDGEIANSATVSMTSQNLTSLSNITYSDGSYKFYIFPKDSAGNVPSSSLWPFISVEFDTTSPVASGITVDLLGTDDSGRDSTDNLTSELQPTFQISGVSDQDSVYLVAGTDTVDRDEAASNTITLTPSSNLPESPSLSVKALARDYAGNLSNASTILSVVTDTTAPNQPNPANLHENYDTGFYSDDDTTNSTTLGFVIGGLVDGDSITFYLNDVQKSFTAMGGYTAPNASGGEVGLLHTPSAPGLLSIKSTVTDSAGNTSAFSDVMTVKLDLVPPGKPGQPDLIDASDTGTSNSDDVTNDLTPTFQIAGVVAGDSVFVIVSNGGESDTTGADFATDDTIQITIDNLTSDNVTADVGIFSFTAFAVDSAGNTSPSVSSALSVTIDTTAPDPPTISLRAGDDSGVLDDDQLTNVMNPSFNVWGADGEDSLYIAAGSDTVYRGIPDESPDIIPTDSTTEGTVIYTALLRDKAGNLSLASADYEVEIDTTQPFAPSPPDLLPASDTGFANDDDITNNTQPSFILTGLSAGTIDSVLILFDGSIVGSRWVSQPLIDTLQIDPQTFNPVEIFDVSVMAIDSAGNVSDTSGTLTVIIDTDIPTAPSDPDLIATSDLGESSTDNITSDNTPTIFLDNLESGSINKLYWVDSSGDTTDNPLEGTVAVGEDSISLTPTSPLGDGTYTIFYSTEDTAGNVVESADLAPVLVIDTQEPTAVISLTDSLVRFEDPSDTVRVTFSEGMSDPPRISVRYAGGGVLDTSDMTTVFDSVWFYVLEDIPDSNDGAATISITTTDNAGNVLDSLDVTGRTLLRLDNTDPVFSQITPDSGSFVNDTRVAYTITEHTNNPNRLFSSTFTWTPIGAGTTVQAVLDSLELAVGSHALDTLSADPQLEDGTLYTLTITSQDSAGNTGLTVVDSVTYDTTGPIVDSLVYSKNPAMLGDTVEVKAYFNEIVPSAPSFTTMWPGVGAGGPFTMDSTVNGEMLVWLKTDVVVPDIISVSGNVEVTPIAQDRATNPIDSLAGMSILYDTTWVIDVDVPTCSLTYTNIDQPTMSNLGKGGDEILITAKFSEQMKGLNDNIPRLSIIFPDTSDHTMEGIPFTSSSNGDTIWTYSFDLPSDSSYTGFMTVRLASYDLAGNLVEDVVDTN
ncbi:MAG: Ig-like domain-containing protein, partial [Fidelibacterota bacterium]